MKSMTPSPLSPSPSSPSPSSSSPSPSSPPSLPPTSSAPALSSSGTVVQPEGNHYDKYGTRNPLARMMMQGFLSAFDRLAARTRAQRALEVGCGEGHLSIRLATQGLSVRGVDIAASCVEKTHRNAALAGVSVPARVADIHHLTPGDRADLVVCCEVLEHVEDPEKAVDVLASLAAPWLLTSVPREPLWRVLNLCRGKYVGAWGNTPGHIQHWSSAAFQALIARRFEVVALEHPLPWTMILAKVR